MNSIRAQNAIIDLLRGVTNDVTVIDSKQSTPETDQGIDLKGGSPAIDAIENVFLAGGNPSGHDEFADLAASISNQQVIDGGDVNDGNHAEEENEDERQENHAEEENEDERQENHAEEENEEENEEEKEEVVQASDFEPDDLDGKVPEHVDDEGDPIEDNYESSTHDGEEEEEPDPFEMKGGASIQRVNVITADLKFPFILKSRRK